jgi:Na+-transporting methylmalonyl-CoA/oxaloacetate decarboxylase gamma subunit
MTGLQDRLMEGLALTVVGMLVVLTALSLTAMAIALLNRLLGGDPGEQSEGVADRGSAHGIEDARLKVVIAAAATAALGRRVRIDRVSVSDTETGQGHA